MNRAQFSQEQMNQQEEANYNLYKKIQGNKMPYYTNIQSNKMLYDNNNDFINEVEKENMRNNKFNTSTQESATTYMPTKENLNSSDQYIDSYNQKLINSTEMVRGVSFSQINKIYSQNNNIHEESMENALLKKNCYFGENNFGYIDTEEMEQYLNKQNISQQINTYKNLTMNANKLLLMNSEQKFSSADEINTLGNSMQTVPVYSHQDLINSTQNNENAHSEMTIDMHSRSETEIKEDNYEINMQLDYYNQKVQENLEIAQNLKRNTETTENTYEINQSYLNANQNLDRNGQEENSFYEHIAEHNMNINQNRYEQYNSRLNDYHHIQQYHNDEDKINQINTPNCYLNTAESVDESYDTLGRGHFSKNSQNGTPILMYKNDSTVMNNEYITHNFERNEKEMNARTEDMEPLDGMMKIKTIDISTEALNHFHQFPQENGNEFDQNIKHHNIMNIPDFRKNLTMQNADFYRNTPFLQNGNNYSNINNANANTFSMNNTMEMKNQCKEMNNMKSFNQTEHMNRYNTYLQEKKLQNHYMSGKEYLNSQIDENYNINDIKSFMLEPKLYTKMNLDLPEVVDGITTNHNDGIVENAKKETILKYKDTWRLIPGKSCPINQNGNNNSEESDMNLFQKHLDISNQKTQNMFLNSSFNTLTGRLHIKPLNNEQRTNDFNKIYDYKDPAVAFPNCYTQPENLTQNGNSPANILDQMIINGTGNENDFNFVGANHFVPTNGSSSIYGANSIKQLNEITGANEINNLSGANYVTPANNFNFPVAIGENKAFGNSVANTNKEEKNITKKKTTKKQTLALCGENRFKFNLKTFVTKTVKDYFKGDVTI